jgi:glutathione S-transferase
LQAQEEEGRNEARQALVDGFNKWFEASLKGSIYDGGFWAGEDITLADVTLIPFILRLYICQSAFSLLQS